MENARSREKLRCASDVWVGRMKGNQGGKGHELLINLPLPSLPASVVVLGPSASRSYSYHQANPAPYQIKSALLSGFSISPFQVDWMSLL